MSEECVAAVYADLPRAQKAAHILQRGGFRPDQAVIVTNELPDKKELIEDLTMGDDSIRDGIIGGGVGAVVGALAGTAFNVITGPFSGGLAGIVVGSFIGNMAGWGVHKQRLEHYETLLEQGRVLVVVQGTPQQLIEADRVLKETEPEELHLYGKTSSESPEVNAAESRKLQREGPQSVIDPPDERASLK